LHTLKQPIYHYDLKPTNILLDENYNTFVTEYGLANYVEIMQKYDSLILILMLVKRLRCAILISLPRSN